MPVLDPFAEEESTFPGTIEDLLGDRLDYNAPFNELLNVKLYSSIFDFVLGCKLKTIGILYFATTI